MSHSAHLRTWTGPEIDHECKTAYAAYRGAKTESYRAYFSAHPQLKDEHHEYKARDLASALPEEWAGLGDYLPESERHPQHLSGNSSQVLALGLLGVGARLDPSLGWLSNALSSSRSPLPPPTDHAAPSWQFEYKLAPEVLDERPRQTSVDFLAARPQALLAVECKWTEAGIGGCSCTPAIASLTSACSDRVLEREAYWETAAKVFHLPPREVGKYCPLSFTYQAVRNVAAARALAKEGQLPVFGLIYDSENPYFSGCGDWPGWPAALAATVDPDESPVRFASVSWQELVQMVPLDPAAAAWASEKHGLHKAAASGG